jgi:phosphatidylglycerophosphate synthase
MFDDLLRQHKDAVLAPVARLVRGLTPLQITGLAFVTGLIAAGLASAGWVVPSLIVWILSRVLDGLDGASARLSGAASDLGGYLDIVLDFVVYAAIPLALAIGYGSGIDRLIAVAVLLASFYVNAASWMMLSAILEKRAQGAAARGEATTITMPAGLAGAVVTFLFFTAFLAWPAGFVPLAYALALLCLVSVLQRVAWAARNLGGSARRANATIDARTWPVIVVGGGAAGLAAAQALQRRGSECLVLEQQSAGWVWTQHYDSLTLNTHRDASALPGLAMPRDYPCFPTGRQVQAYLAQYAATQGLTVRNGVIVIKADPDDRGWRLITSDGEYRCADLVMATGIWSHPHTCGLPGSEAFEGELLHSSRYRRPGDYAGRHVLVVGAGNSGAEIAAELGEAGVETTIAVRSGATFVSRPHSGLQMSVVSALLRGLPRPIVNAVLRRRRADFADIGLPRERIPEADIYPVVGFRLPEAVRAGKVRVVGTVAALTAAGAHLADGAPLACDVVVLATGYRPALGPVAAWVELDDGWPMLDGFRSRRHPHLYVLGTRYSGLEGWLQSIGRYADQLAEQLCNGPS